MLTALVTLLTTHLPRLERLVSAALPVHVQQACGVRVAGAERRAPRIRPRPRAAHGIRAERPRVGLLLKEQIGTGLWKSHRPEQEGLTYGAAHL